MTDTLNPEQKLAKDKFEEALKEMHTIELSKAHLIMIFNLITSISMKYGDFINLLPVIKILEPIVAVESSKEPEDKIII